MCLGSYPPIIIAINNRLKGFTIFGKLNSMYYRLGTVRSFLFPSPISLFADPEKLSGNLKCKETFCFLFQFKGRCLLLNKDHAIFRFYSIVNNFPFIAKENQICFYLFLTK